MAPRVRIGIRGGSDDTATSESRDQVEVTVETRADVGLHGFWKRGTTKLFDITIVNLDAAS